MFYYDKKVILRRYNSSLGEYNRPIHTLTDVGVYDCSYSRESSTTSQLQPQKDTQTEGTLYVDMDVDVRVGDVCCIYELDEYDNIILSTEFVAVADKPYRIKDHIEIPLVRNEEV